MAITVTGRAGSYDLATAAELIVGHYIFELTGTGWQEMDTTGMTKFYLENTANDGDAIAEVLNGNAEGTYGAGQVFVPEGRNTNIGVPIIKWLYDATNSVFYKVLNVLNNDLIEVEAVNGSASLALNGVATRGYGVKIIDGMVSTGGTLRVKGYGLDINYPGATINQPVKLTADIDQNGPLFMTGTGSWVNIINDTSLTRLS